MEQDKNKKISLFTIVLILLNLALLFTVWYPRLTSSTPEELKKNDAGKSMVKAEDPGISIERYIRTELHFSDQQVLAFKQMQAQHLSRANILRQNIYRLRNEIMTLLFNDNPNKSDIEELSYQLGLTHEKLEKEIFFHFMELMAQCRPEQRENFKKLLQQVFEKYRPPSYPGLPPDMQTAPRTVPQPERRDDFPRVDKESEERGKTDAIKRDLETLTQRLSLTFEQVKQIEEILLRFHTQEKEMARQGSQDRGDPRQLKDKTDGQIEAILTPQQLQQFKKFKEETRQAPGDRR